MESSQFTDGQSRYETIERMETQGATCDTFRVKLYGKLHFLKRLKAVHAGDIRYQEALRKEFETGYRLEHPHLVRYLSLDGDSILMEYVDGESLAHRLATNPDYFKNRKNTDKFIRQLLSVVGYLHSHQVLHLDLKPDNILLTRINDDVKLVDLGCCYTDTFPDTTGHTHAYAAPEQLSGNATDVRTDIYAIGRILESLPSHSIYNKVIARCTASNPADRYQSIERLESELPSARTVWSYYLVAAVLLLFVLAFLLWPRQNVKETEVLSETSNQVQKPDSVHVQPSITNHVPSSQKQEQPDTRQTLPAPSSGEELSAPSSNEELSDNQRHDIRQQTLAIISPIYQRMIVPIVHRVQQGDYDERMAFLQDSISRVYVKANEEVYAELRKIDMGSHYPRVSPEEVFVEQQNAIGDAMYYYSQVILRHRYPGVKLPPNPFAE